MRTELLGEEPVAEQPVLDMDDSVLGFLRDNYTTGDVVRTRLTADVYTEYQEWSPDHHGYTFQSARSLGSHLGRLRSQGRITAEMFSVAWGKPKKYSISPALLRARLCYGGQTESGAAGSSGTASGLPPFSQATQPPPTTSSGAAGSSSAASGKRPFSFSLGVGDSSVAEAASKGASKGRLSLKKKQK